MVRTSFLVRSSTSPDDIQGMMAARGIVTDIGGATSHAAVVSRELHRPSVVGCGNGIAAALAGKQITIDGTEGEVRDGILELTAWSEDDYPRPGRTRQHCASTQPIAGSRSRRLSGAGRQHRGRCAGSAGRGSDRCRLAASADHDAHRSAAARQNNLGLTPRQDRDLRVPGHLPVAPFAAQLYTCLVQMPESMQPSRRRLSTSCGGCCP